MRPYRIFLTLLMTACLISLTVNSNAFTNKPEDVVPDWQTAYPYQRNISLDFTSKHSSGSGPIPGALYEGYLDKELWGEDILEYSGLTVEPGKIGIAVGGSGWVRLNLNNLDTLNPVKRVYMEATVTVSDAFQAYLGGWVSAHYELPAGHTVVDSDYSVGLGANIIVYGWVIIEPNPASEYAVVEFNNVPVGHWAWIHDLRISSECVGPMQLQTDLDSDGDVDGMELARMAATDIEIALDEFAMDFGEGG